MSCCFFVWAQIALVMYAANADGRVESIAGLEQIHQYIRLAEHLKLR